MKLLLDSWLGAWQVWQAWLVNCESSIAALNDYGLFGHLVSLDGLADV